MALINTLLVDIAQPSEKKEVISSSKTGESSSDSSQFSSYMAYEQGKSQADKRQLSGNEHAKNADTSADVNSKTQEKQSFAKGNDEAAVATQEALQPVDGKDKTPVESIEFDTTVDDFHNKRAEVAIKLLDFINASEETSTDPTKIKIQEFTSASVVAKGASELTAEQVKETEADNANSETSDIKSKAKSQAEQVIEVKNVLAEAKGTSQDLDAAKEQSNNGVTNNAEEHSTDAELNQVKAADSVLNSTKSAQAEQVNANNSEHQNTKQVQSDVVTNVSIPVKVEQNTSEPAAIVAEDAAELESAITLDKSAKLVDSTSKPATEPTNNREAVKIDKTVQQDDSAQIELDKNNQPISSAQLNSDIANKVAEQKVSEPRIINQATNTLVSSGEGAKQETNAEQESAEQSNKQQSSKQAQEALVKEQMQTSTKTAFTEQISERVGQTATFNPNAEQDARLQTAHERELASIQAATNRPSHEALSTQSVKSAQAVMQETISINRKDFSVAVKEKVMVAINQKLRQLDIRLDPPELGSMQVKLNLQNEQAAVSFVVQSQQTKEALEQHMGKLRDMLSQSGVDVGDANIEHRDGQNSEQASADGQGNGQQMASNAEDEMAQTLEQVNPNLYKASSTGIDYYA